MAALASVLDQFLDQHGVSIMELSRQSPILIVLLRHSGCTFCRQTLAELKRVEPQIVAEGARLVLVLMESDERALKFVEAYGLGHHSVVSDPNQELYAALGLARDRLASVAGPRVWWRGLKAILSGHWPGVPHGDVLQMPGTFLIRDGEVLKAFRHQTSADQPDYCELAKMGK